ncbi:MAG: Asp-tRNA(Asn)/Glu-tRNA(Gln) amidotransferase subunit GatB [Candidatus Nealsonbacteria bacterium]|nr:Asp-tRNA(Asn)/Glu-tRNA(Gln) amidotransferase subunit GatB [Candidatus Nealsonbacteria bacterium]
MAYKTTIGLEIHAELKTKSKMFCDCLNDVKEHHPNVNICPICMGHPGVLPVINEEAVKKVIKTGLALGCKISERSKFDRKNYFYPDLPKGYQISQYDQPLCSTGTLNGIKIKRVHLEEDTGRLVHPKGADYSLVDFNRAGVPLMELVTEPELSSAKEARLFAEELQLILRYLGVSDADMEKGQMRVEANISLSSTSKLGTKTEIKNLNSFRAVEKALDYEIARQAEILKDGKKVIQETRGWDDAKGITVSQRLKEEAKDYRYFPEPDLPVLHFTNKQIKEIMKEIPEIPQQRRERLKKEYGLGEKEIEMFTQNKDFGEYFEKVVSEFDPKLPKDEISKLIKLASNYLITDLQGLLKGGGVSGEDFAITPENFADFISLINDGKISSKIAKMVLVEMFSAGADPSHIIEEKGLSQIDDHGLIENIIKEVISQNPNPVADYKKGKVASLQFLVGQVMSKTKGRANPEKVRQILLAQLK